MGHLKKTGVLGGTFNPIHTGHLVIAENARDEFKLDEVLIMPAHIPPHKRTAHILDDDVRMEMIEKAVEGIDYFVPCDYEIRRKGVSYTSDTLTSLRDLYPDRELYLIMGADSLMNIESWHCPEIIFKSAHLLAAARDEANQRLLEAQADRLAQLYGASVYVLSVPKMEISSTMIRERVRMSRTIRYFVPETVRKYIEDHHLYR